MVCVGGDAYNAREGHHGEAAVLKLGQLEARAISTLAKSQGVEAEVTRLAARALLWCGEKGEGEEGREGRGRKEERRGREGGEGKEGKGRREREG